MRENLRSHLRCECLEHREVPAVNIFTFGQAMFVVGDSADNVVQISDNGAETITASIDNVTKTASGIRLLTVLAAGGDDLVRYTLTAPLSTPRGMLVNTGSGDDVMSFDASAGVAAGGLFGLTAAAGDGKDTIAYTQGGIALNGIASALLDGGNGDDTLTATGSGVLAGRAAWTLSGGNGNDTASAQLDTTADSKGQFAAAVFGGFGNDAVRLTIGGTGITPLSRFVGLIDGGPGTDSGVATDGVFVRNCES